jgi:hypothetical protein
VPGIGDTEGEGLLAALGLRRGEAAEVLHQHLMARRARGARARGSLEGLPARPPAEPATSAELVDVLRGYAARKAAFGELMRQGKLPPRPSD